MINDMRNTYGLAFGHQPAGHDTVLATDVELVSVSDARVLTWAVGQGRPVLARDHGHFAEAMPTYRLCESDLMSLFRTVSFPAILCLAVNASDLLLACNPRLQVEDHVP